MRKIVGLKEYFGNDWRDNFAKEETMTDLFSKLDISDHVFKSIITTHAIDDDRCVVVAKTTKADSGHMGKVILDVRLGQPSWTQAMDITFNIGEDCDKRIILFDGPREPKRIVDPSADRYLVGGFVKINNDCGLDTQLVHTWVSIDDDEVEIKYDVIDTKLSYPNTGIKKLPSRREFQEAEFWAAYLDPLYGSDPPLSIEPGEGWFSHGIGVLLRDVVTECSWTDEGLFFYAIADKGSDTLKIIWERKREELEGLYKGCRIELEEPRKLSVRERKEPFKNIIHSTSSEKEYYAEELRDAENKFADIMEEFVCDLGSEKKVVNS